MQLPSVYAAVTLINDMVGMCVPAVYRREGDEHMEDARHPVALLLREPNTPNGIGMSQLMKTGQGYYNTNGNGYLQVEREPDGTAVRLWPLLATETHPLTDGATLRGIVGYRTQIGGRSVDLPTNDVIHVRNFSRNGWVGESPVALCVLALQSGAQMEKYGLDFFLNESKSGGFLMHPGKLTDDAKRRVRKSLKDQTRNPGEAAEAAGITNVGVNSHHELRVLEEGMKFVDTTITPEEGQFLQSREFINSEVARIWRVPLVLLQSIQGSSVWGTGIETLMISFVRQTILPILQQWADEMSRKLFSVEERLAGYYIKFDASGLMQGDAMTFAQTLNIQVQNKTMTVNEARRAMGRNPVEGGDEPNYGAPPPPPPTAPNKGNANDDE